MIKLSPTRNSSKHKTVLIYCKSSVRSLHTFCMYLHVSVHVQIHTYISSHLQYTHETHIGLFLWVNFHNAKDKYKERGLEKESVIVRLVFDRRLSLSRDFPAANMAAEDLPSEFDVVILGTGSYGFSAIWSGSHGNMCLWSVDDSPISNIFFNLFKTTTHWVTLGISLWLTDNIFITPSASS